MKQQNKIDKLLRRAIKIQKDIDELKPKYAEMDDIMTKLQALGFKGQYFGKYDVFIEDNFEKKNVAFRTTSFRHYDLKIVKTEK